MHHCDRWNVCRGSSRWFPGKVKTLNKHPWVKYGQGTLYSNVYFYKKFIFTEEYKMKKAVNKT